MNGHSYINFIFFYYKMFQEPTQELVAPTIRQKLSKIKPVKKKEKNTFLDKLLPSKFINNYFNKNAK